MPEATILAYWEMRSGRNHRFLPVCWFQILAYWEMRSGRNWVVSLDNLRRILAYWEMRSGRNATACVAAFA